MSLTEAYTLAHTAQCRLQIAASRPDRDLRFIVGHLMHYESLRLRIVEIEHDISMNERANISVRFRDHPRQAPRPPLQGRKSPPPTPPRHQDLDIDTDSDSDPDSDDDMAIDDDEADDQLSLQRFPSAAATQPPLRTHSDSELPELDSDHDDDDDEDEPRSPDEPSRADLENCIRGEGDDIYATMYEGVRKCTCHGKAASPAFERMWSLPLDSARDKPGVTRAVAQVSDAPPPPQAVCSSLIHPVSA
jgi:hypothetical protein